jgi:hypothetical protein
MCLSASVAWKLLSGSILNTEQNYSILEKSLVSESSDISRNDIDEFDITFM